MYTTHNKFEDEVTIHKTLRRCDYYRRWNDINVWNMIADICVRARVNPKKLAIGMVLDSIIQ